jgi:hypothetical protein
MFFLRIMFIDTQIITTPVPKPKSLNINTLENYASYEPSEIRSPLRCNRMNSGWVLGEIKIR